MSRVRLERLGPRDLPRIGEVDRAELIEAEYLARPSRDGRSLTLERVPIDPPRQVESWTRTGIDARIGESKPRVKAGGVFLGALIGSKLIGFAVLGPSERASVELCALFVDRHHRRLGVGSRLMERVEQVARDSGAESLWLGSNRTASAVEFYLKHGYAAISLNRNDLIAHRLGDPVFGKTL